MLRAAFGKSQSIGFVAMGDFFYFVSLNHSSKGCVRNCSVKNAEIGQIYFHLLHRWYILATTQLYCDEL
ncbi:MAG: hypothetical protein C4324_05875 [Blastocatellia bacterium]